jgi:hypothetical protein
MTIDIDGTNIAQIIEIVGWVGSVIAMLIVGLLVYLMVRPPRHVRKARLEDTQRSLSSEDAEEMWRLMERMEARLEVLERAIGNDGDTTMRGNDALEPADGRQPGGMK